jgi:hypothetical protein
MDTHSARLVLIHELSSWRCRLYKDLAKLIDRPHVIETIGPDGEGYQIEIQVVWDSNPNGNLRVIGAIDDRRWRAIAPLCESFIMTPAGDFIGELPDTQ